MPLHEQTFVLEIMGLEFNANSELTLKRNAPQQPAPHEISTHTHFGYVHTAKL